MKTKPSQFTTTALLAALVFPTSLHAIETPEDNTPPPAPAAQPAAPAAAPAVAAAYLGIITSPAPQALRDHLNLGDKNGVIVSSVIPDSPAAKAGLDTNDIITGINDKKITSPQEINDIIANHKPGDEIRITSIRKGKATEAKATLSERPAHMPMERQMGAQEIPALEGMPEELTDRIRRMVEDNANGFAAPLIPLDEAEALPDPKMEKGDINEVRKKIKLLQGDIQFGLELDQNGNQAPLQATFRMMDNDGSIELKSNEVSKEVTVRDQENNVTWEGPWDTEQDKAAAPEDIRQRIERLNIGRNGPELPLNFRPQR